MKGKINIASVHEARAIWAGTYGSSKHIQRANGTRHSPRSPELRRAAIALKKRRRPAEKVLTWPRGT